MSFSESHRDGSVEKSGRFRSLFSFSAFHFMDDGFADSIYLILPFIAAELHLSFSEVGLLKGVFSGAMSLLQFPMSILGEKVGETLVVSAGIVGLISGFLFLSFSYSFPAIVLSLIWAKGTGAGQHGLSSSVLSKVFEGPGRRAVMGTYNFFGDMGKLCIPFLVALTIPLWGWRQAIFILALAGLLCGAFLFIFTRYLRISPSIPKSAIKSSQIESRWGISNFKTFIALLAIGVIDICVRNVLLTFLPFLLLQRGITEVQVGFALTLLFLGGAVGKFVCGVLAERFGVICMVVVTEILTSAGILGLFVAQLSLVWVLLPLVGIVLNGTSSVLYATVADIISPYGRSRGYGFYYAVSQGSGALSPVLFGLITDALGLSFTILSIAAIVLITVPLSRFLAVPK